MGYDTRRNASNITAVTIYSIIDGVNDALGLAYIGVIITCTWRDWCSSANIADRPVYAAFCVLFFLII